MKFFSLTFAVLALAFSVPAQTTTQPQIAPTPAPVAQPMPVSTFSFTTQAMALPGNKETVPASVSGAEYAFTKTLTLVNTDIIAPGLNMQAYYGGFNYYLPTTFLSKTQINPSNLQLGLTASAGISTVSIPNESTQQHYSFLAGGFLNWKPGSQSTFSMLARIQYIRAPYAANSSALVAFGPVINIP